MASISVHTIRNKRFSSNTYLVTQSTSTDCVVIDPGTDSNRITDKITELGLTPRYILATHGHFDHVSAAADLKSRFGAQFCIHEADLRTMQSINFYLKMMRIDMRVEVPAADILIKGTRARLELGMFTAEAFLYPGHTAGSCLFQFGNALFTGDTLYVNGIGVNPFPGQNKNLLRASLADILGKFPEDLQVYPGHGEAANLAYIKSQNQELNNFISITSHD